MAATFSVISPIDGQRVVERPKPTDAEVDRLLERAARGARAWAAVPTAERVRRIAAGVERLKSRRMELGREITLMMGRPIRHSPFEIDRLGERAHHMLAIAEAALAPLEGPPAAGVEHWIVKEPVGVVFVLAPWNYPYLTAGNVVIPALAAGNAVVLKHSAQTPLVAESFVAGLVEGGVPEETFQFVHASHEQVAAMLGDPRIGYVSFTGSVAGGRAVRRAAAGRFVNIGLELGAKDPAYVCEDVDLTRVVPEVADGAFFNAGQSCCAIKRIYVHAMIYDAFVDAFLAEARKLVLGDPRAPEVTLGPLVRAGSAEAVRAQIGQAVSQGGRALVPEDAFPPSRPGTPYLAPQVLVDVNHRMAFMREETFGPAVGLMRVASDEAAITLMNDSRFGLTASVWTQDPARGKAVMARIEAGTCLMNRADYIDPAVAWVGLKDSGCGVSLSPLGYLAVTRPKSFYCRIGL